MLGLGHEVGAMRRGSACSLGWADCWLTVRSIHVLLSCVFMFPFWPAAVFVCVQSWLTTWLYSFPICSAKTASGRHHDYHFSLQVRCSVLVFR